MLGRHRAKPLLIQRQGSKRQPDPALAADPASRLVYIQRSRRILDMVSPFLAFDWSSGNLMAGFLHLETHLFKFLFHFCRAGEKAEMRASNQALNSHYRRLALRHMGGDSTVAHLIASFTCSNWLQRRALREPNKAELIRIAK